MSHQNRQAFAIMALQKKVGKLEEEVEKLSAELKEKADEAAVAKRIKSVMREFEQNHKDYDAPVNAAALSLTKY